MDKKTIFISSTYSDLKSHRDRIWDILQDFDVNITGMEEFGARSTNPLDTCIEELESSDVYIGIISMRYGSVDEASGKSYTQLEYERAKEIGLETYLYLIDDYNGEVKTGNVDFDENALRLKSFKKILKMNHTVAFFINEVDLSEKIINKLKVILPYEAWFKKRPEELDADVFQIELNGVRWYFLIGYLNKKPYEIFSAAEFSEIDNDNGFLLPQTVVKGILIKLMKDDREQFDFIFCNKRGFKTRYEGLNFSVVPQITSLCAMITKLFQNKVRMEAIIDIVREMQIDDEKYQNWNKVVIKILNGEYDKKTDLHN